MRYQRLYFFVIALSEEVTQKSLCLKKSLRNRSVWRSHSEIALSEEEYSELTSWWDDDYSVVRIHLVIRKKNIVSLIYERLYWLQSVSNRMSSSRSCEDATEINQSHQSSLETWQSSKRFFEFSSSSHKRTWQDKNLRLLLDFASVRLINHTLTRLKSLFSLIETWEDFNTIALSLQSLNRRISIQRTDSWRH